MSVTASPPGPTSWVQFEAAPFVPQEPCALGPSPSATIASAATSRPTAQPRTVRSLTHSARSVCVNESRAAWIWERYTVLVIGRRRQQVAHAGVGDDPAAAGHDQVVGGVLQLAHQVARDQHGAALGGEGAQEAAQPDDPLRVHAVERLVEHQ